MGGFPLFLLAFASAEEPEVTLKPTEITPGMVMLSGEGGFVGGNFPAANVLHAGDAYFGGRFPFIDLDAGGSVDGYIQGLATIASLANDETQIIPGHGAVATRADVQKAHDMLVDADKRVGALLAAGRSEDEVVAANPLALYDEAWSWSFITTEKITRTLYQARVGKK